MSYSKRLIELGPGEPQRLVHPVVEALEQRVGLAQQALPREHSHVHELVLDGKLLLEPLRRDQVEAEGLREVVLRIAHRVFASEQRALAIPVVGGRARAAASRGRRRPRIAVVAVVVALMLHAGVPVFRLPMHVDLVGHLHERPSFAIVPGQVHELMPGETRPFRQRCELSEHRGFERVGVRDSVLVGIVELMAEFVQRGIQGERTVQPDRAPRPRRLPCQLGLLGAPEK